MQSNRSSPEASPAFRFASNAMQKSLTLMLLLLLTTFLLCGTAAAADQTLTTTPAMTIWPTVGPPTTQVLVSGFGFDPHATVDIYFDATHLAQVTTNGMGAFGGGGPLQGIAVQAPASALPGTHWIIALERSGQKMARRPFLVRTDWAQYHFDAGHSGLNPYENVLSPANVGGLQLDWSYQTGGPVFSSPAVAGGVVYVGSEDNNLYALNATTGALLWKYTTGGIIGSSPAVANGAVYFGSFDNNLYALNATTGALLWQYTTGGPVYYSPAVANGVVYFGSSDNNLYALNATTGALLWQSTYGPADTVAVANNRVFFGSVDPTTGNAMIYALDAGTGALVWSTLVGLSNPYGGFDFSTPAVTAPYLYVNVMSWMQESEYGMLLCLDMMGGGIYWQGPTGGVGLDPAVGNGMVYDPTEAVHHLPAWLSAYRMQDGVMMWQYLPNGYVGSPAAANGLVYFGAGSTLYGLNASTGGLLWQYPVGVESSPAVANGVVYVGSGDGNLYAFGLTGGSSSGKGRPIRVAMESAAP